MVIKNGLHKFDTLQVKQFNYKFYSHSSNEHNQYDDSTGSNGCNDSPYINDGNASNGCMQW